MLQRWQLLKLGKVVVKIEQIDDEANEDDVNLIEMSNEMFLVNKGNDVTNVLQSLQPKESPSLFDFQKKTGT